MVKAYFTEGDTVKKGQLLAEIDTPDLDQQILQAKAELASMQANATLSANTAKRWQTLQSTNFVSSQAVEEKNADLNAKLAIVNASQANVNRLQAMKNFSRIVAPFDGTVIERHITRGEVLTLSPGSRFAPKRVRHYDYNRDASEAMKWSSFWCLCLVEADGSEREIEVCSTRKQGATLAGILNREFGM